MLSDGRGSVLNFVTVLEEPVHISLQLNAVGYATTLDMRCTKQAQMPEPVRLNDFNGEQDFTACTKPCVGCFRCVKLTCKSMRTVVCCGWSGNHAKGFLAQPYQNNIRNQLMPLALLYRQVACSESI